MTRNTTRVRRTGQLVVTGAFLAVAVAVGVAAGPAAFAESCDLANGESVYQKCAVCHPIDAGAPHGAAPNLHGVVERPVGKVEGFKFSRGLRKSGATWTHAHFDAFLADPQGVYPRNRMAFGGLKNPADRGDVLCYLRERSGEP